MSNLVGQYQFTNSTLLKQDTPLKLIIGSRKKPTPQKPKFYLLQRFDNGKHKYLSSLYPLPEMAENSPQGYSLDHEGTYLTLIIDREAGKAEILTQNMPVKEVAADKV